MNGNRSSSFFVHYRTMLSLSTITALALLLIIPGQLRGPAKAAASPGGTILIDNFNDGNADNWDQNDATGGRGTFDATSGSYVLGTSVPIPVDDPSVGTVESHWIPSLSNPRFANGTIRATIRANTPGTTVDILMRDNDEFESGYDFCASAGFGTFYIDRFEGDAHPEAPQTFIAMGEPGAFLVGHTYNIEVSIVSHRITLKAWEVNTPEPSAPTLSVTDKVLKPGPGNRLSAAVFFDPGSPLLPATEVTVNGTFDDITYTPGPAK